MIAGFALRLRESLFACLVTLTIALCTVWQALLYPFGLASKPSGRRMTSTFVGEAAHNGRLWGRVLAPVLDGLFVALGDAPDHCGRAYRAYRDQDD